jgi:drug/metabolite transporter (DMT)-like permease
MPSKSGRVISADSALTGAAAAWYRAPRDKSRNGSNDPGIRLCDRSNTRCSRCSFSPPAFAPGRSCTEVEPVARRKPGIDRSTLLGLLAILLWSSSVALVRRASEQLGPWTAGGCVYLTAGVLLAAHYLLKERSLRKLRTLPRRYAFGCGVLFVLYTLALYLALGSAANRYQTVEIGLLNYLWPALTILLSLPLLGHRADARLIPGTLLALLGVFLVLTQGTSVSWTSWAANLQSNPAGYGLGLLAAVAWALYSNLSRRWGKPDSGSAVLLFMLAAGAAFWLIRPLTAEPAAWTLRAAVEVGFLGLATALGYVFWDIAMRAGDLVLVAACSYLTPFFSTVVSCLYLGILPGLSLWLGCLLIITGSFLSWRSIRPIPPGPTADARQFSQPPIGASGGYQRP